MKNACLTGLFLLLSSFIGSSAAAGNPSPAPQPVTMTFYIAGMECGSCMALITQSINEVKSVTDVEFDIINGYANVTFDAQVSSAHQIAQAVADTTPVHGKPFVATMKLRVPDYAKSDNAPKVDAVFEKRKAWVEADLVNKEKGEFVLYFSPLQVDKSKDGPQGWNPGDLAHALHDASPKGLGLAFELKKEEPYVPVLKAAK